MKHTILLLEDDANLRMGLAFDLEAEGYEVIATQTCKEAVEAMNRSTVHAAILDVNLPDGDGFEVCKRIKQIQDIPVIFLTARDMITDEDDLKSLLGDISHQVKTPIANIKMYNNILIEREVPKEKQIAFLQLNNSEIDKLDFLIQAMIKMSRLENGVIQLQPKLCDVLQTLANALAGVSQKAEAKQIEIDLACDEKIEAYFDPKWTEEAVFNVIENAVKYTKDQDTLVIRVEVLEIYVVIHIIDHGIGIAEAEQGLIFRRFYRSPHVQHTEGVGVGLALAREMLTKQQGFIKVIAAPGEGSKFSIYLPKENLSKL